MDRDKILKMIVILAAIVVIAGSLSRLAARNSMSLDEYASINGTSLDSDDDGEDGSSDALADSDISSESNRPGDSSAGEPGQPEDGSSDEAAQPGTASSDEAAQPGTASSDETAQPDTASSLVGASLTGSSQLEQRVTLAEGFYYEPISDNLRRYMTGISFPAPDDSPEAAEPEITFQELMYVHILHYDFEGDSAEGELICNAAIAQDLTEIFQELYRNEYRLEKVLLIEAYDGDDTASMEDNNTSCFNYRPVEESDRLSKHAYGLAIDINPLYNPYITYAQDGTEEVSPPSALPYADRSARFPYKIDEDDLCYKLFTSHGFIWGGNWNSVKDYQHFQKTN